MSCYSHGYSRNSAGFGYGGNLLSGLGTGSSHTGYRPLSCCPGGFGATNPIWGRRPCGQPGGIRSCSGNQYDFGTVVTHLGCGFGVGARGTGGLNVGPYASPCAEITIY
jgi:hypothetical protein